MNDNLSLLLSSWPGLPRPSTWNHKYLMEKDRLRLKSVDGQAKPGHDEEGRDTVSIIMRLGMNLWFKLKLMNNRLPCEGRSARARAKDAGL